MKAGFAALFATVLLASCSQPETRQAVTPQIVDEDSEKKDYSMDRGEYEAAVQAGMQTILRWYFVKPAYSGSERFVGYQIVEIYKLELKDGPLVPGDILISVNDLPIERPEQAMLVWRGLWGRKTLKLTFQREGKVRSLVIPVVDEAPKKADESVNR